MTPARGANAPYEPDPVDKVFLAFLRLDPEQRARLIAHALSVGEDPKGARNDAIKAVVRLTWRGSISASAKELASRLQTYAGGDQWAADRDRGAPTDDCAALRRLMFTIVEADGGAPIGARQIARIVE